MKRRLLILAAAVAISFAGVGMSRVYRLSFASAPVSIGGAPMPSPCGGGTPQPCAR